MEYFYYTFNKASISFPQVKTFRSHWYTSFLFFYLAPEAHFLWNHQVWNSISKELWLNKGWVIMSWVSNRLRNLDNRSIHQVETVFIIYFLFPDECAAVIIWWWMLLNTFWWLFSFKSIFIIKLALIPYYKWDWWTGS